MNPSTCTGTYVSVDANVCFVVLVNFNEEVLGEKGTAWHLSFGELRVPVNIFARTCIRVLITYDVIGIVGPLLLVGRITS